MINVLNELVCPEFQNSGHTIITNKEIYTRSKRNLVCLWKQHMVLARVKDSPFIFRS